MSNRRAGILIAPDKFKGSLTAYEVAAAVANGVRRSRPDLDVDLCPVADGGDGTLDAALSAGYRRVPVEVEGPVGQRHLAAYGERDGVALVELAEAVGLRHLIGGPLAPLTASTYGMGQLIEAAIKAGNHKIILAVGGSASSDGGAGIVQALGAELVDDRGQALGRGGGALEHVDQLNVLDLRTLLRGVEFVIASDVDSPLLGPMGAATVFGPQKGASPADVAALERGLARWASIVAQTTGIDAAAYPGAGAAGGVGFGAIAILGATVVSGADMVLEMVQFDQRVRSAALVVTGEGSLDEQSLSGKAPIKVAQAAQRASVPAVAVAGRCTVPDDRLFEVGIRRVYSLNALEPDLAKSIANAGRLLELLGEQIALSDIDSLQ